jgi:nitrate reductase NapAB chaperone NapD
MPICSYLVTPIEGKCDEAAERLRDLAGCRVTRAEQCDLLVVVTETASAEEECRLQEALNTIDQIQCLALTFGQIQPGTGIKEAS